MVLGLSPVATRAIIKLAIILVAIPLARFVVPRISPRLGEKLALFNSGQLIFLAALFAYGIGGLWTAAFQPKTEGRVLWALGGAALLGVAWFYWRHKTRTSL